MYRFKYLGFVCECVSVCMFLCSMSAGGVQSNACAGWMYLYGGLYVYVWFV